MNTSAILNCVRAALRLEPLPFRRLHLAMIERVKLEEDKPWIAEIDGWPVPGDADGVLVITSDTLGAPHVTCLLVDYPRRRTIYADSFGGETLPGWMGDFLDDNVPGFGVLEGFAQTERQQYAGLTCGAWVMANAFALAHRRDLPVPANAAESQRLLAPWLALAKRTIEAA